MTAYLVFLSLRQESKKMISADILESSDNINKFLDLGRHELVIT